jgi:hypothetical protein
MGCVCWVVVGGGGGVGLWGGGGFGAAGRGRGPAGPTRVCLACRLPVARARTRTGPAVIRLAYFRRATSFSCRSVAHGRLLARFAGSAALCP